MAAPTQPTRREEILAAAAELFARHGFHGVGIDDIGAAVGISGPALYRHFSSKDAILGEMLVSISKSLLEGGSGRVAAAETSSEALSELVSFHTDFAMTNPALITVQERDLGNLRDTDRGADVVDAHAVETVPCEEFRGGGEDLLASGWHRLMVAAAG